MKEFFNLFADSSTSVDPVVCESLGNSGNEGELSSDIHIEDVTTDEKAVVPLKSSRAVEVYGRVDDLLHSRKVSHHVDLVVLMIWCLFCSFSSRKASRGGENEEEQDQETIIKVFET